MSVTIRRQHPTKHGIILLLYFTHPHDIDWLSKGRLQCVSNGVPSFFCDNPAGLLASRQRVWLFGRIGKSAGSRLWVGYKPRFEYQWDCRCRDVALGARPQTWESPEPTDCHVSLWPGENGWLPDRADWCHWGREECDNPAGLLASRPRVWLFGRIG